MNKTIFVIAALVGSTLQAFGDSAQHGPPLIFWLAESCVILLWLTHANLARRTPMKYVAVRANQNTAGIYGAVTRIGRRTVGQTVVLHATAEKRKLE